MRILKQATIVLIVAAFVLISNSSFGRSSTILLLGDSLFPESIAYQPYTQKFYISSFNDGSIQTVNWEGNPFFIQPAGTDGRTSALGVKIDPSHERLWVIAPDAVYIYDLKTNTLLQKNVLTNIINVQSSLLNDLSLDQDGNAYITDSYNPYIFRIDGKTLQMSNWLDVSQTIPFGQQNGVAFNLNGIVITPNEKYLLTLKTNDGSLWKIDIAKRTISQVQLSEPVTFGDGITWQSGKELFVMRNFINKISRIEFSQDYNAGEVTDVTASGLDVPTSAVYTEGKLVVVNSQFDHNVTFGGDGVPILPFHLALVKPQ